MHEVLFGPWTRVAKGLPEGFHLQCRWELFCGVKMSLGSPVCSNQWDRPTLSPFQKQLSERSLSENVFPWKLDIHMLSRLQGAHSSAAYALPFTGLTRPGNVSKLGRGIAPHHGLPFRFPLKQPDKPYPLKHTLLNCHLDQLIFR